MSRLLLLSVLLATGASVSADPQPRERRGDQFDAYQARQTGRVRSLREIESQIVPRMGDADYLGPEFDPSSGLYRLKFMRQGRVIWVDVDGRSGVVVGRSGR